MPSERVRELERLLARIREAGNVALNYDMWERWGAQHTTPEEAARMHADFARAMGDREAARTALEALVARTRAEAPAEIAAWAAAHDAYLAAFLRSCTDGTAIMVAQRERGEWAEVRDGARAFVEENVFFVTSDAARYRRLFGIDLHEVELAITLAERTAGLERSDTSLRYSGPTDPDQDAPLVTWALAAPVAIDDPVAIAKLAARSPMPASMLAELARRCVDAPTAVTVAHGTGHDTRWARALARALLDAGRCTPRTFTSDAQLVMGEIVWGLRVMPDGTLVGLDANLRCLIVGERRIEVPRGNLDAYDWLALFDGAGFPAIRVPPRATNGAVVCQAGRWLLTFTDERAPPNAEIWRAHELVWTHLDRDEQVRHPWNQHTGKLVAADGVVWCPTEDGLWRLVPGEAPVRVWTGSARGLAIADGVAWVGTADRALLSIDLDRGVETSRVALSGVAFDVRIVPGGIITSHSGVSWIVDGEVIATAEPRRDFGIAVLADGTAAASSGEQVALLDPSGTLRWCPPMPFDGCIRGATRDRFVFGAVTSGEDHVAPTEVIAFDRDGRITARLPNRYRLPIACDEDHVYVTGDQGVVRWDPRGSAQQTELVVPPPRRPTERGVTQIRPPVTNPRDDRPEVGLEIRHTDALVFDGTYGGSPGPQGEAAVRVCDGAIATFVRCDLTRGDGLVVQRGATVFAIQCKLAPAWALGRDCHLVAIECTVGEHTGRTFVVTGEVG